MKMTGVILACAVLGATGAAADALDEAPACELTSLDGSEVVDLRELRGKIVYVDFWASWCTSCVKSFAFLNALDGEFRDEGLHILGVNVDERRDDALGFLAKRSASFALAADPLGSCPRAFGVKGMPSSYLIDRQGRIRETYVGFRPGEASAIRERVVALLAEPAGDGT